MLNDERISYLEDEVIPGLIGSIGWDATRIYGLTNDDWTFIYNHIEECNNCGSFIETGAMYTTTDGDGNEQDCCDSCYSDFG